MYSYLCLQRHFAVFAVSFPNQEALSTIYTNILAQHLAYAGFPGVMQRFATLLVHGALSLHQRISTTFLPTAIKFHYIFNLRDLSNIFQVRVKLAVHFRDREFDMKCLLALYASDRPSPQYATLPQTIIFH